MTRDQIMAGAVLVDFVGLNVYALASEGIGGLWTHLSTMGAWGFVLTADLFIALGLCAVWMWRDARRRGTGSAGHIVLTMLTGSVGPLLYLLRRPREEARAG